MKVHLRKVSDNPNAFRGAFIGQLEYPIEIGKPFEVTGTPLSALATALGGQRLFTSSHVKNIVPRSASLLEVHTENSIYEVEYLEPAQ